MAKKAVKAASVVYNGTAHIRRFSQADILSMGLEVDSAYSFNRGQPHEVSAKLADLLVRTGEFTMYEEPEAAVEKDDDMEPESTEVESTSDDDGDDASSDDASGDQDAGEETPQEDANA